MAEVIYTLGPNNRIRLDTNTNKYSLEFYNSAAAAWEVVEQFDTANKLFEVISKLTANVEIEKSEPRLILDDKAAGGVERRLASSGGTARVKDAADADVMNLEGHAGRHKKGGADAFVKADVKDLLDVISGTVSIDPPSIAAGATANVDVTVTGLTTSHKVIVLCQEDLEHGLVCIGAYVPAADALRVRVTNWTAAAIDGVARTWAYLVFIP